MADIKCPIPQVEIALQAYIRSRQDALQVRQALYTAVQERLEPNLPLSQALLTTTDNVKVSTTSGFKQNTIYKQFADALSAHQSAQARYQTTKTDLDHLKQDIKDAQNEVTSMPDSDIQSYVSLVRQRTQKDRMELVRQSLTRLEELDPHPAKADLKQNVKNLIGLPPDPPTSSVEQNDEATEIDEMSFKLKKSLLQAKSELTVANTAKEESFNRVGQLESIPQEVRLLALQRARDELIQWIEAELTKVADESDDADIDDTLPPPDEHVYSTHEVQAQVQDLYHRYIASRQSLMATLDNMGDDISLDGLQISSDVPPLVQTGASLPAKDGILQASQLLARLPVLMQTARDEASVLQQTTLLRKQTNLSSSSAKGVVQRLAGESHLVSPNTVDLAQWGASAASAALSNNTIIRDHVQAGKGDINNARQSLAEIQAKRSAISHLDGDK